MARRMPSSGGRFDVSGQGHPEGSQHAEQCGETRVSLLAEGFVECLAGYAGLAVLMQDSQLARAAGLNKDSRVLVISTEGATAPLVYRECVGETADSVLSRQAQWLEAAVR